MGELQSGRGPGAPDDPEELVRCYDRTTGLRAVIAIDDTTLGPGLGGVRWQRYRDLTAAADEARRLARVMTLKQACADLPYGGAKAVLLLDDADTVSRDARDAKLRAFGTFVERLGGAYVPGVDMGTSTEDLAVIGSVARSVSCDEEDPSPKTALGVFAGIRAALGGTEGLGGAHVVVQGAGHVGAALVGLLAEAGCRVSVADVDWARAEAVAVAAGGDVVAPDEALATGCDVLAPCAGARVLDATTVERLRTRIVAGAANDVLATPDVADLLAARHVVYVPDFVINAGGVIDIHALRVGWGEGKLRETLLAIGDRVAHILDDAARTGRTPLRVAEALAAERLGRPIGLRG